MKRSFEWTRHFNQAACPRNINISNFLKNSKHDAICPKLLGHDYIFLHGLKLLIGVIEITAARANHDIKIDGQLAANRRDQSRAGSDTTFKKIAAQLDSLRAAALRRDCRLD